MEDALDMFVLPLLIAAGALLAFVIAGGAFYLVHYLLTTPMRRAERARFFLDLVQAAIEGGRPVEESLISAARSRDSSLGSRFQTLAAVMASGRRLADALTFVPRLLPPQIVGMLKVGQQIGGMDKVLPACRQFLRDALSETRSAVNYVVVLAFVVTPMSLFVYVMLFVKVMPAMWQVAEGVNASLPAGIGFVWRHVWLFALAHVALMVTLWFFGLLHALGPRATDWMPFLHRLYYRLPWRRKRMNRDFSLMLAVLLDARVPEAEAVALAADCTNNRLFRERARRVADELKRGAKLTDAIQAMDDAGEFRWRLRNAAHAVDGFRVALAGWHEALDAKAFQQEQAAAHLISTALVLLNGFFVGTVVTSVFGFLISILQGGHLW